MRLSAAPALCLIALVSAARAGENYLNETDLALEADTCFLLSSSTIEVPAGGTTPLFYGRVFEAGATEAAGADASVIAQAGYGPEGSDPRFGGWQWFDAYWNFQIGNEDEYGIVMSAPVTPGNYSFTFRFSLDSGASWTLTDLSGAGSAPGFNFEEFNTGTLIVGPALNVIFEYANFKSREFEQTSAVQPSIPTLYALNQRLFGDALTPEAVGDATVTMPDSSVEPLTSFDFGVFVSRSVAPLESESALDAAAPGGEYTFTISGGTLGKGTGTLAQPVVNLWTNVPYVTNYESAQSLDALADNDLLYNTPVIDGEIDGGGVFWSLLHEIGGAVGGGFNPFTGPHTISIASGTLSPATSYILILTFSARDISGIQSGAFAGSFGEAAWDSRVILGVRTAPACPGDADGDGMVNFADITEVLANFGLSYLPGTGPGDADGSGVVNFADITSVLSNFGASCD